MAFRLGIDLGTSTTVAVLAGPASTRPLLFDASPLLSSAVFAGTGPDLLTGLDAERAAVARPAGLEANPKRRIDDGTVWLGERDHPVAELLAAVLRRVAAEARRVAAGPIAEVVLTHPAAWGRTRLGLLADAAARAGLGEAGLVPEPVAAAAYFATARDLRPGHCVVVYDLGAGTFDVSVVRRGEGFEVLAADGLTDVGGLDLDAAVVQHARSLTAGAAAAWGRLDWPQDHADQQARRALWVGARAAKEQLTRHATADLHLPLVGADVHLTREEFERAARPYLDRTVALTVKVLRDAGVAPERIDGVFLVGGSSRIPLAATLLHRALRIAPAVVDQPELAVAEGSLLAPVAHAATASPTAELRAVSLTPVSAARVSAAPVSAVPVSAVPVSAVPVSAVPVSASPVSASPVSASPVSAMPVSASPGSASPVAPVSPAVPAGPPVPAARAPRPRRRRLLYAGLVIVLLAGAGLGVRLWLDRGPVVAELRGHAGAVRALAFSPDGTRLATAGDDGTVRLWNVKDRAADGAPITTPGELRALAFSRDGKLLAAAGSDQKVRFWDVATRAERNLIPSPNRMFAVNAIAFNAGSTALAMAGEGGTLVAYDLSDGHQLNELNALSSSVINAMAFHPTAADRIVLGGGQPVIVLGNTVSNNQPGPVVGVTKHAGPIRAVAYRPDGEMVASGGADGSVLLWPDQAGVAASKLTGHTAAVNAVAFDRTGATVASAGDDRTVRLWSPSSLAPLGSPYDQARSVVDAIAFSPKETDLLATASRDGVVRLWRFG